MRTSFYKVTALTVLVFFAISCKKNIPNSKENIDDVGHLKSPEKINSNLNISILLDLSDRISPEKYPNASMEFYQRDVAYINSVAKVFQSRLNNKKINQINDRIQLFFEPEPLNPQINKISETLRFNLNKTNISKEVLSHMAITYQSEPLKIYELAISDNKYVGSDTWKFFKNKVHDYTIQEGYRNILIILTDGYMFHKDTQLKEGNKSSYLTPEYIRSIKLNSSNWEEKFEDSEFGFIPATQQLENLEILVLGINPDTKNVYEEEVIKKYWSDWFDQMGVARYQIKNADLPSNMDKIIRDFILKI